MHLLPLGDLDLTLPAAAATSALLLAWGARRAAWCWTLLFMLGFALVGVSKIAFMGWGTGWQALCFKALSGHAAGVTAVYPPLLYLLLHGAGPAWRQAGAAAGLGLGLVVALQLVATREHSPAEALAGWCMGALVSGLMLRLAGPLPPPRPLAGVLAFCTVFVLATWIMQRAHFGWWMIKAARLLSGQQQLFPL